ncbi:MAG: hypothetical protein ACI4RA_10010, partial [Kiritimatiellia bacterium]
AAVPLNPEDPYADAKVWIKEFVDDDADGLLQGGELRSTLATAAPWSSVSVNHDLVVTNEWVATPYRGGKHLAKALYFPQTVTITNEALQSGYGKINTITLNNFTTASGVPPGVADQSYTIAIRFRPDNNQFRTDYCWIFNWGYNGTQRGFNLGLSRGDYVTNRVVVGSVTNYVSYRTYTPSFFKNNHVPALFGNNVVGKVHGNKWHDLIISLDGDAKKVRYVLARAPWDKDVPPFNADAASDNGGVNVYTGEVSLTEGLNYTPDATMILGSEATSSGEVVYKDDGRVDGNVTKCFRGSIHQLATWNRAMEFEEMKRVLAFPRGDLMSVGVRDGTAGEFRGGASADQDAREWTLPGAFAAGDAATITFRADRKGEHEMQQVFRWYGAADSASGAIRLTVNGVNAGVQTVQPGRTARWLLKSGLLVEGENTLEVARVDAGTAPVKLDAVALGGSWQVGHKDDSMKEFAHEGQGLKEHEVLDGNTYSYRRVLFGLIPDADGKAESYSNTVYTFTTPREFRGQNYSWTVSWKELSDDKRHLPRWSLNGHDLGYSAPADRGFHSLAIPSAYFTDGVNRLELLNSGVYRKGYYYYIDYMRLELSVHDGTLFLLR